MRLIIILSVTFFAGLLNAQVISEKVVLKMVKEDIYQYDGRLLGVTYVDSLKIENCNNKSCELSFSYEASGCHWDMCYELSCKGILEFDLAELETEVKAQKCIEI